MTDQEVEVFKNKVVRLCELTVARSMLEGITFDHCHILGPAVIAVLDENEFSNTTFEGDPDAMLWVVPPGRKRVLGAVGMRKCRMLSCRTTEVGFAGPPDFIETFKGALHERAE